jgi:hypothetical protein
MTALAAQTWSSQFPNIMKNPSILLLALALLVFAAFDKTAAAPDDSYQQNDLLMFFLNPTGTTGNDRVVLFSLGSTWDVFRRAATPTDPTFGTVISLGNINTILTSTYGSDWTGFSSTLFVGAAGNNGSTSGLSTAVANGDYARTVYVTKPRLGAGSAGQANSSTATLNTGNSAGTASAINGANSIAGNTNFVTSNPASLLTEDTTLEDQNPFGPTGAPATAYGAIQGGVVGATTNAPYSLGSVSNIVNALDLYRITPNTSGATAWQNLNNIEGVAAGQGYYLGTITLSDNGAVNFIARGATTPVTDDYTAWANSWIAQVPAATSLTNKSGDYDNDGFQNVNEYAFGTDPTRGTPALTSTAAVSNNLIVSFFRRSGAPSQVPTYTVFSATNLLSGFAGGSIAISASTNPAPAGYESAAFSQPVSGNGFYRVRATLP